ncbi:MAG TPA: retroviral-like aspartic protease family protein [Candidatus Limnocylindrales bacterium]|nr:retroviral-like aspartic protease family protein [Candidatus Limnocylindrales bacterium]
MGYVRVHGTVANSSNHELKAEVDFLVDTGAIYSVVPKKVAEKISLKELGKRKFRTGSGIVEMPIGEAYLTVDGEGVTTIVAISFDENMPVLLGVTTLELLGLQVDPLTGKLKPLDLLILYHKKVKP